MKKENNKDKKVKNENKKRINGEKTIKCIKILSILLLIVLISMIGFVGIYKEEKGDMKNTLKDYQTSMALNGKRIIKMTVKADNNTNNTTSNMAENATTENSTSENGENITNDVPNENKEEVNNTSNETNMTNTNNDKEKLKDYKKSKNVIEDRLKTLNIMEYTVSLNEKTGDIDITIPEDSKADNAIKVLQETGKFEIIDADTNEVLMNNDDIKSAKVMYGSDNTSSTSGTTVYLEIEFNKKGKETLDNISKTYVKSETNTTSDTNSTDGNTSNESADTNTSTENNSTDSENTSTENTTNDTNSTNLSNQTKTKNITMKIDDQTLMTTYFSEEIKNGKLDLTMGSSTSDESELQKTLSQAYNYAALLGNGELKNEYKLNQNQYILSNITQKELIVIACVICVIALVGIVNLIVKFKLNGLLSGIAYIGFGALCTLILRYTNVIVSLESLTAIFVGLILNYMFIWMLLKNIEKNKKDNIENYVSKACSRTYGKFFLDILPIYFVSIVCCFIKWIPISSFGMASFWSISLIAVYNVITYVLLNIKENN